MSRDKWEQRHGKPVTKKVVSHVRDMDEELDLSREEREAVLNQHLDKALQDYFYWAEDNLDDLEQEELEENLEGTKIEKASQEAETVDETDDSSEEDDEAGFKKASEVKQEEEEDTEGAEEEESESEGNSTSDESNEEDDGPKTIQDML